jgi:hypothetical protein
LRDAILIGVDGEFLGSHNDGSFLILRNW